VRGVVFDIESVFAHFRKIYTNSSSLSYSVPPRTTIHGILAAVLGYERDSYYSLMDSSLHVSVKKNNPTYKMTHTLNYIRAESAGDLVKAKKHTQIPLEVISSAPNVSYKVYAAADKFSDMEMLIKRLKNNRYVFPPTLGTAFFLADISNVSEAIFYEQDYCDFMEVSSIINADAVEEIKIKEMALLKEKMPRAFGKERTIKSMASYYVEDTGGTITTKLKKGYPCWKVNYMKNEEFVVFM
jgi:CRISPR-associated protein Cas5h